MCTGVLSCLSGTYVVATARRLPAARLFSQSLIMGIKRKKSAMALMPEDENIDERSVHGPATDGPRRSGRLQDKDGRIPRPQPIDGLHVTQQAQLGSQKTKRGRHAEINNDRTEVAVSSLREMEDQFRNECKRQKKAIKESNVQANEARDEYSRLMPRVIKAQPETLSAAGESRALKRMTDPEQGNEAACPEEDPEAETQRLQEAKEAELLLDDNDFNIIKQEGARPPPVNSDYLPLPWKGRLGYVNTSCSYAQMPPGTGYEDS